MAGCFIHGSTLVSVDKYGSKQACLKIYRDKDEKELSISFDNSLGGYKDECKRIEARIFPDRVSTEILITHYINDSEELSDLISAFVSGII